MMLAAIILICAWLALNVLVAYWRTYCARRRGPRVRTVMSRGNNREVLQ